MSAHLLPWELLAGPVLCSVTLWLTRWASPTSSGQRAFNGCYLLLAGCFFAWSHNEAPLLLNAAVTVLPLLCMRLAHQLGQVGLLLSGQATTPQQGRPLAGRPLRRACELLTVEATGRRAQQLCIPRKSAVQHAAHCLQLFPN